MNPWELADIRLHSPTQEIIFTVIVCIPLVVVRIPVVCSERFQVSCVSMNQTSNTNGASLTESGVIQTTVRTPRRHDRRAATGNFTPQSPEARRRRVWAPRDASMGTPLNLEADLDATIGQPLEW